jgi:hypothetical protein
MRCVKHNAETNVFCGRCETPVCPKCMVHSDVGVRCRSCSPPPKRKLMGGTTTLFLGAAVIVGILIAGSVGGFFSGKKSNGLGDLSGLGDIPGFAEPNITADKLVDPWVPPADGKQPASGHRFVAVEVVLENPSSSSDPAYTVPYSFKLVDTEGFVYGPNYEGAAPLLNEFPLNPGEKTRGWLTFEVDQRVKVASLTYDSESIALPR